MNTDPVTKRDGARILKRVDLGPHHRPQSQTRHYLPSDNANPYPPFVSLEIAQYDGSTDFYLFHITREGENSDTWHASLQDAMDQAEFEFEVKPGEWQDVSPKP